MGICADAETQLWAGAAWAFYWTTRDVLCNAGHQLDSTTSTTGAGGGPDQVGQDELTRYAIGTTARPTLEGFLSSCQPIIGTEPRVRSSATRLAGQGEPSGEQA